MAAMHVYEKAFTSRLFGVGQAEALILFVIVGQLPHGYDHQRDKRISRIRQPGYRYCCGDQRSSSLLNEETGGGSIMKQTTVGGTKRKVMNALA